MATGFRRKTPVSLVHFYLLVTLHRYFILGINIIIMAVYVHFAQQKRNRNRPTKGDESDFRRYFPPQTRLRIHPFLSERGTTL